MIVIYIGLVFILVGICLFFYSLVLFLLENTRNSRKIPEKKTEYDRFCSDFDVKYSDILPKNRYKVRL